MVEAEHEDSRGVAGAGGVLAADFWELPTQQSRIAEASAKQAKSMLSWTALSAVASRTSS